ncbi:lipase 3 isoform X2 [Fopius arisanus]|uniref:Lipase n=2 Tax=Fopius arisanus TaxID=64838 RepID=A0A9R1T372_9HYME|nr:PREDICTED: lipase 3-like isoform X2 [Fopius arisanus]
MNMFSIVICLTQLFALGVSKPVAFKGHLNFTELVEQYGYTPESHVVTTEDGYNIRLDRISGAPTSPEAPGKPVVYLLHGLGVASEAWILWTPNNSLAFLLADAGYDVWLGNIRGTTHGRSHQSLDPDKDREFWNFDLTTISTMDLPAQVDFILEKTGESKLTIIGHSMGTTLSYIFLSEKPTYNNKVNLVLLVAGPDINAEVMPHGPHVVKFADDYCNPNISDICLKFANIFMQKTTSPLSFEELRHLMEYAPAGSSLRLHHHYLQNINSGNFQKYDYESTAANIEHYGQETPSKYNLSNIDTPVVLIYIKNDFFSPEISTRILEKHLPNIVVSEAVPDKAFVHADFIFHKNVKAVIYDRVIKLIGEILKIERKL